MLVMITESVTPRLRGELSLYMVEVQSGVFVGRVNTLIRNHLWSRATADNAAGKVVQAWNDQSEQGFCVRIHGDPLRSVVDIDGVVLVAVRNAEATSSEKQHLINRPET
jgi:CRISPR-associated protein Cas2